MGLPGRPEAKTLKVLSKGGSLAFQKRQPAGAAEEGAPELWARGKMGGRLVAVLKLQLQTPCGLCIRRGSNKRHHSFIHSSCWSPHPRVLG